jgi:hypothetical protein
MTQEAIDLECLHLYKFSVAYFFRALRKVFAVSNRKVSAMETQRVYKSIYKPARFLSRTGN